MKEEIDFVKVAELISRYDQLKRSGELKNYNEEKTKTTFINPLFAALGWNIYDKGGKDNSVTLEEKISKKRVDYGFRINGIPKFFLEAKALRESNIQTNRNYLMQAIDYAWMKSCSWAILTNFETIAVINADVKDHNVGNNIFFVLHVSDFLEDERFEKLSKASFMRGELNTLASKWGKSQFKNTIDKQLLQDMIRFRALLSKSISINNRDRGLDEDKLDESVQRILDRLIFIRNAEDRELEENQLQYNARKWSSVGSGNLIKEISRVYRDFDNSYNSELFKKHLCDSLFVDNDTLLEVIEGLNHSRDNSYRYDFSIMEADTLGGIYEQYLGNILKKTSKRAKLEASRTHRKEQGIYYTPSYIVDYIVENTLGEYIKDNEVDLVKRVRIIDPACGSGSFLIKAYQKLEDYWHKNSDFSQLTLYSKEFYSRRLDILRENIFGVDLDPKAVEIAQLNLLLKLSEKKQKLPYLRENIKVGNSLVDDKEITKHPFDWNSEFGKVMDEGGFDIVIGNPPYGLVFELEEKDFLEKRLPTFRRNNDLYVAFMELGLNILREGGIFSFIVPNTYLIGSYFDSLKRAILKRAKILKIVNFGRNQIFEDPNVFNSIIVLQKESDDQKRDKNRVGFYEVPYNMSIGSTHLEEISTRTSIVQNKMVDLRWEPKEKLSEKIYKKKDCTVGDICHVKDVGFNYWSIGRGKKRGDSIGSRVLYDGEKKNKGDVPYLKGRDIERYAYSFGRHWLKQDYMDYLIEGIDIFRFSAEYLKTSPKLVYRQTADRIIAAIDYDGFYLDKTVHLIVPKQGKSVDLLYLMGILNSKLMLYYYRNKVNEEGRTFAQVKTVYIKAIPYKERCKEELSSLVATQIECAKELTLFGSELTDKRLLLVDNFKKIDKRIDNLVYEIYGLNKEEIKLVESSFD